MRTTAHSLCLLLLGACTPGTGGIFTPDPYAEVEAPVPGAVGDDADTSQSPCNARVSWVTPRDDQRHVQRDSAISVGFSDSVAGLDWSLRVDGVHGTTTLNEDGRVATFRPSAPAAPHAVITVHAAACGHTSTSTFESIGPEVAHSDLVGRHWAVRTQDLTWLSPSNAGLVTALAWPATLLFALDGDADAMSPRLSPQGLSGCAGSVALGELALSNNPRIATAPVPLSLDLGGTTVTLHEFSATGVVESGGAWIVDLEISALLDARGLPATPTMSLCDVAELRGEPCAPCPDGAELCVPLFALAHLVDDVSEDLVNEPVLGCMAD